MSDPSTTKDTEPLARLREMPVLLFIRGLGMVLFAVGLVAGLHGYLGLRLIRDAGAVGPAAVALWMLLWALFLSMPLGVLASRTLPRRVGLALQWVSHLWMGTFGLLLTATAASDLALALAGLFGLTPAARSLFWGQAEAGAVWSLVVPSVAVGFVTARGRVRVVRVKVPIRGLGAGFEDFRLVQLTDLHVGDTLDRRWLARVVAQVNSLEPDLVVITGDLVDGPVRRLRDEVAPLAELFPKRGTFFVTGNHEYYSGVGGWVAELRRLGLTVLLNEHRVLEAGNDALVVGGVTDHDAGRFGAEHAPRPDLAFAGAPEGAPRLLLAHQPRTARLARDEKVSLQLSGHTHGGQMFPWMFLVRLQQPVISGLATLWGVPVYTSKGTGYWGPPLRLGARPELTEITLTRAV